MSETKPHENPLIPNKKLRQIFVAMVEMRMLDEHIAGQQHGGKTHRRLGTTRGQEACRVGTAIDLASEDLISDAQASATSELLSGAKTGTGREHPAPKNFTGKATRGGAPTQRLPWVEHVADQLYIAVGAALAVKAAHQENLVLVYVQPAEVAMELWKKILRFASKSSLPMIFVVLPGQRGKKEKGGRSGNLSAKAQSCGVPGIPVDGSDVVALYRVMQESIGRTRAGGGPVLIECAALSVLRKHKAAIIDPLVQARDFLLSRKVCSKKGIDRAGGSLQRQIESFKTGAA